MRTFNVQVEREPYNGPVYVANDASIDGTITEIEPQSVKGNQCFYAK
jgi:hypothetical protein